MRRTSRGVWIEVRRNAPPRPSEAAPPCGCPSSVCPPAEARAQSCGTGSAGSLCGQMHARTSPCTLPPHLSICGCGPKPGKEADSRKARVRDPCQATSRTGEQSAAAGYKRCAHATARHDPTVGKQLDKPPLREAVRTFATKALASDNNLDMSGRARVGVD